MLSTISAYLRAALVVGDIHSVARCTVVFVCNTKDKVIYYCNVCLIIVLNVYIYSTVLLLFANTTLPRKKKTPLIITKYHGNMCHVFHVAKLLTQVAVCNPKIEVRALGNRWQCVF